METRYPRLNLVSLVLKVAGASIILIGIGACLWYLMQTGRTHYSIFLSIVGIFGSCWAGLLAYSFGELICCITDIEYNTRASIADNTSDTRLSSIADKQRQISRLQSEIVNELRQQQQ